jgi:hypothetical protein
MSYTHRPLEADSMAILPHASLGSRTFRSSAAMKHKRKCKCKPVLNFNWKLTVYYGV